MYARPPAALAPVATPTTRRLADASISLSTRRAYLGALAPPFSFTGTWTGPITIAGTELPPGTATVTITQTGSSLSGTWSTVYPTEPPLTTSGAFSGTANGMALQGTLSQSDPDLCSYTINATVSGTVMTGTFATVNCTGSESGTVMLTRQ